MLPSRRCPFSVLLINCEEGLSSLIQDAEVSGAISGTSICRGPPSVSHLLFDDDCFLLFKEKDGQAQVMKNILNIHVSDELKNSITDILAVRSRFAIYEREE